MGGGGGSIVIDLLWFSERKHRFSFRIFIRKTPGRRLSWDFPRNFVGWLNVFTAELSLKR